MITGWPPEPFEFPRGDQMKKKCVRTHLFSADASFFHLPFSISRRRLYPRRCRASPAAAEEGGGEQHEAQRTRLGDRRECQADRVGAVLVGRKGVVLVVQPPELIHAIYSPRQ